MNEELFYCRTGKMGDRGKLGGLASACASVLAVLLVAREARGGKRRQAGALQTLRVHEGLLPVVMPPLGKESAGKPAHSKPLRVFPARFRHLRYC